MHCEFSNTVSSRTALFRRWCAAGYAWQQDKTEFMSMWRCKANWLLQGECELAPLRPEVVVTAGALDPAP